MDLSNFTFFENNTFTFPCGDSTFVFNDLLIFSDTVVFATELYACGRSQGSYRNSASTGYTKLHIVYTLLLMVFGVFVYT